MKKLLVLILSLAAYLSYAQPSFEAVVDTQQIKIGEVILLQLKAQIAEDAVFIWPELPGEGGIEIIETKKLDTLKIENGLIHLQQELRLTSFDSGASYIPALNLKVNDIELRTDSVPLLVFFPEVKEDQDIFDIKGPREIPFDYWRLLYIGLALLGLALVVLYIIRLYKQPTAVKEVLTQKNIPPGEWALEELQKLEDAQLWQSGKLKAYYSELVDILRIYLERKFAIKAMESTADELIQKLKPLVESDIIFRALKSSLQTSALVKYARHKSTEIENRQAIEAVRDFIKSAETPKAESDV